MHVGTASHNPTEWPTCSPIAEEIEQLMAKFPGVVNCGKKIPPAIHHVRHAINTTCSQPVRSRYRRLDPEKLAATKAEFKAMEEQGIIQ